MRQTPLSCQNRNPRKLLLIILLPRALLPLRLPFPLLPPLQLLLVFLLLHSLLLLLRLRLLPPPHLPLPLPLPILLLLPIPLRRLRHPMSMLS